jgi:tripartite-type tricarboxylate transporter receptor subunit TctC
MLRAAARVMALILAILSVAAISAAEASDAFPSRPITIVVPLTPGTAIDILARLYADKLSPLLGQPVVVLNKPGAAGAIGAEYVANAIPDGHTLIFANSAHAILGYLNTKLPFDPVRDFSGVAMVGSAPAIVVVSPALGVANLKEFIALAKAKPGELNYGSAGIGTSTHLAGAYFASQTGLKLVHVPYTVSANILSDLMGGSIQASFDPLAFVLPLLQSGKIRGLAVGADVPVTGPVAIPTAISQGVDYKYATWYGILAPRQTPKPALKKLADAIATVSTDPELKAKIAAQGINSESKSLDAFDAYIRDDIARLGPLTREISAKQ